LYNRMLRSIAQCQKRDGRVVGVRSECRSVDDAVAGIPSSAWTGTVYQHLEQASVEWLEHTAAALTAPWSLAWAILALAAHGRAVAYDP